MQLVVDHLGKSFGTQDVFKDVSFMVNKGERVCLIGVNGSGKSTLLNCLLHPDWADAGSVRFAPGISYGYVEQGFGHIKSESIWEYMLRSCPEILTLRLKLAQLEKDVAGNDTQVLKKYAQVTQRYEYLDGYHYEEQLKKVLLGLAFPESCWKDDASQLSGGQKTRMMLASALVSSPDFLLLDEPTNNLDMQMTEWLEEYLQEFKGGLLLVSHDRAFLDHVATKIIELENGKLLSYPGNYTSYLAQKEIQMKTVEAAYSAQQSFIAQQEAYIRRFKAGIKSKMARGRQSRLDRLEKMEAPVTKEVFSLQLPPAAMCADRVLIMENLEVGYGRRILLHDINLTMHRGEKVALIGPNGTGKSTLVKTLVGEIPQLKGKAQIGNRVKLGYFSQSYERLNENQTLLDNFLLEYGLTDEQTRSLLGGMLFHGDDVFKTIGSLSGGQKARLVLLKLVMDGANCLVLDEPTNHLDILAKETLEAALNIFNGTVLLVSHDRYLVREIADRIWSIEDGRVKDYKGGWDFYQKTREKAEKQKNELDLLVATEGKTGGTTGINSFLSDSDTAVKGSVFNSDHGKFQKKTGIDAHFAIPAPSSAVPMNTVAAKLKKNRAHNPEELQELIAKVELRLREEEAMLGVLDQKISIPENQLDPNNSRKLAEEREAYLKTIDGLMEKWENLLEEQEAGADE